MGRTRGRKKSGSRRSRKCDILPLLSKEIVLRGGNASATDIKWVPVGVYTVISVIGALEKNVCPNNNGRDGPPGTATLFKPLNIDIDSNGNLIIVEIFTDNKIRMMSPAGNVSTIVNRNNVSDGSLASNGGIHNTSMCVINKANDVFYFVEYAYHRLRCMIADSGNTFSGKPAPGLSAGINTIISTSGNSVTDGDENNTYFHHPIAIAVDPRGTRMYISEETGNHLRMVDITGPKSCYVSTLFQSIDIISHITVDNNGNVFFTTRDINVMYRHSIWKFVPPAPGVRTTGERKADGSIKPLYSFTDPIYGPKVFAGSDTPGYKDGAGANARFNSPMGLCVDKNNNLYVADCDNNVIRYITPDGNVFTYAGVQSAEPNLDGVANGGDGTHMTARFSNPRSVAIDKYNSLFVLDMGKIKNENCVPYARIRKISRVPPLTLANVETDSVTITWPPPSEWMPDILAAEGTTYSYIITPADRDFEVFSDTISSPLTVSNLSDSTRYSIQIVISNSSYTVTTPPFPFVTKIEESNFVIRTPVSTTVAGKGNTVPSITTTVLEWDGAIGADTLSYSINPPDSFSRTTVSLPRNHKTPYTISDLDASKTYTITLTASMTNAPGLNGGAPVTYSVTSPSSTFTTPDPRPMEIGRISGVLKEGGDFTNASKIPRAASTTTIQNPRGIVLDKHGNLFVTSQTCVLKIAPPTTNVYVYMRGQVPSIFFPTPHTTSNSTVTIYAGKPYNSDNNPPSDSTGDGIRFYNMSGMAYDPLEDAIYISDSQLHIIIKLTSDSTGLVRSKLIGKYGAFSFGDGPIADAQFNTPKGIAIGPDGSLFIADCYNHAVRRIYKGNVTTIARANTTGTGRLVVNLDNLLKHPYGIAALYDGSVYVTSTWRHCIKKLTPNGDGTYTISLYAGQDSDTGSDADGTLLNARFNKPQGLFVDLNNNIYVYDAANYKIKLISGGRVMTVFGGEGYRDGNKNDALLRGAFLSNIVEQDDYAGLTSDNNGNIYFTDWGNGLLRCAFPEPPPIIDKATYDAFWGNVNESAAVAQTTSSARRIEASSARIQRASSAVAQRASSALAQRVSSARESSAVIERASSAVIQRASSAVAQRASSARESSAVIERASSAVIQRASSAVAERASSAQVSSAVAQGASSAVIQRASSAVAERASSAQVSSAVAQVASSAVSQRASSAVAERASSAQVSSAVAQGASSAVIQRASSAVSQRASSAQASSAVAQVASSAVSQRASSAVAERASSAQVSSAVAQEASSAVSQRASSAVSQRASSAQVSSAVAQEASSARQLRGLIQPVSIKDTIVKMIKPIQSELDQRLAILYSKSSTEAERSDAQEFITDNMPILEGQWVALSQISARIFAIAPMYQDRDVQTAVYDNRDLDSKNLIKMFDLMRKSYIIIDSNGYIVSTVEPINKIL